MNQQRQGFVFVPVRDPFEKDNAERMEAQRKAREEEEKRRKEDEAKWRTLAFMPRKEPVPAVAAAPPVPEPLFEEPAPRFFYDPRPTYVPTPRPKGEVAALVLHRLCKEDAERWARAGRTQKRKLSDLDEEEWRTRGDYPECREEEEREAKRRRKSPRSAWWTAGAWVAGALAVGRLFGVF
jgi:hypothetical protein